VGTLHLWGAMPVVEPEIVLTVAADRAAAGEARHAVAGCGLVGAAQEPTLLLLVSELVSNSVRHAGMDADEQIRLRARCDDACAYVEVCDAGRSGRVPEKRAAKTDALEPGGLGLFLVDEMADRWGVRQHDDQTCVWFELASAGG
jgi:anti-sigma regulatory factor (Ser/Thr protein kinase)